MGHDTHFLSRLERLDHRSLDLALGLYRDPLAVKFVLSTVELPDDGSRVALALTDAPDPPHIVVARDGGFVTCLGPGMSVGRLPLIGRAAIDAAFEDSARVGRADARILMRGGLVELIERVLTAGHRLAREDFEAAALMAPLIQPVFLDAIQRTSDYMFGVQRAMSLRRLRRTDRQTIETLRRYAIAVESVRHVILVSIPAGALMLHSGTPAAGVAAMGDFGTFTGDLGGIAGAACFAAGIGPGMLPGYAERWREADDVLTLIAPLTGLIALAVRHPETRAEVVEILGERQAPVFHDFDAALAGGFADVTVTLLTDAAEFEAAADDLRLGVVEAIADQCGMEPDAVPDLLVNGLLANLQLQWMGDHIGISRLPAVAAWAARLEPSDLYLPAEHLSAIRTGTGVEGTRRALAGVVRWEGRHVPVVRDAPKVGRNDPCPCGSGRKYKRCCIGQ